MYVLNFNHRTSGAGMPRSSIMAGFGGTEKIKDARPLHVKAFVQQCIRQLHEARHWIEFNIFNDAKNNHVDIVVDFFFKFSPSNSVYGFQQCFHCFWGVGGPVAYSLYIFVWIISWNIYIIKGEFKLQVTTTSTWSIRCALLKTQLKYYFQ